MKRLVCMLIVLCLAFYSLALAETEDPIIVRVGDFSFTKSQLQSAIDTDIEFTELLSQEALTVYFYGVASGLLNASLRLMRVTHYEVQSIMYRVSELFPELCLRAQETPLSRMTGYAPMTDILAAVHSQGRVRLFMS